MTEAITCANLEALRRELDDKGYIHISRNNPPTAAKLAIVRSLGSVGFVDLPQDDILTKIPVVEDSIHCKFIVEALKEAELADCWVNKVGAVVAGDNYQEIARGHNYRVLEGSFCQDLDVDIAEVRGLILPGEKLDFCQAIHDVEGIVAKAARDGISIGGNVWYLSLEPCDRCANLLVAVEPKAVYFSYGLVSDRYVNSVGLERLMAAQIPTFFVRMT